MSNVCKDMKMSKNTNKLVSKKNIKLISNYFR